MAVLGAATYLVSRSSNPIFERFSFVTNMKNPQCQLLKGTEEFGAEYIFTAGHGAVKSNQSRLMLAWHLFCPDLI